MRKFILACLGALGISGAFLVGGCLNIGDDCKAFYDCSANTGGTAGAAGGPGGVSGTAGTGAAEATCTDKIRNGTETDQDCGGKKCSKCEQGKFCNDDADCKNAHCADGICCETACDGLCEACSQVQTGKANGLCAPLPGGDPANECEAGDGAICSLTGECDGTVAACAVVPCPLDNAEKTSCVDGGGCAVVTCMAGFGDCDMMDDNGCEKDVSKDVNNCGACDAKCEPANAKGKCDNSVCLIETCNAGADNCDMAEANGCEALLDTDVDNCGKCGRACDDTNVQSKSCAMGKCNSTCDAGHSNCVMPPAMMPDDGCEAAASGTNCGGCKNQCTLQGANGNFVCEAGDICGCNGDATCHKEAMAGGTCDMATSRCVCNAMMCNVGEACIKSGPDDVCSCEGNAGKAACGMGQTCCQTPAGCKDLQTDAQSCGACGRACAAGLICKAGACACDGDDTCNAGTAGTCDMAGLCRCGAIKCTAGERCQPDGKCG